MGILRKLGFYSYDRLGRPGAKEALIQTVRSEPRSEARLGAAKPFDFYGRYPSLPSATPPRVYTSGTSDMVAFLRAALRETKDLFASIVVDRSPLITAFIRGMSSPSSDLGASIRAWYSKQKDMYTLIQGWKSSSTEEHRWDYTIISTPKGISIVRRFLTKVPDIYAEIYGWVYKDLLANIYVRQRSVKDLFAYIGILAPNVSDLLAYIGSRQISDLQGSVYSVVPEDILAYLQSVPGFDISGILNPVPGIDLPAISGGHFPADIYASLISSPPKDLKVFLRVGLSGTSNISASINSVGKVVHIPAYIRSLANTSKKLKAYIIARVPKDLRAWISGWAESDLMSYINGIIVSDVRAVIWASATEQIKDMVAWTRASFANTAQMSAYLRGFIRTHTSDKPINYHRLSRPFNRFIIGTGGGLSFVTIEPIIGYFPDLHASIVGNPFSTYDMHAFIRPSLVNYSGINAAVNVVTKVIHINKIPINFVNLSNIYAYISAFSGYRELSGFISGWKSAETSTPAGSGWVYVSSTIKFYLGTNNGLFIPDKIVRAIRPDRFSNTSNFPDLWGYLRGWEQSDIQALISVQPYSNIYAYLVGQDLSHLKTLQAFIQPFSTVSLGAVLNASGSYKDMVASLSVSGASVDMAVSIKPYLKVLGYRIIPVETKPFLDLRAVLNPIAACGYYSTYTSLGAFIRTTIRPEGGADLLAYINSLSHVLDINASIVGRKITRIKMMNFMFRAQNRYSYAISATIVGKALSMSYLTASIVPLHHMSDFYATITPYYPSTTFTVKMKPIDTIKVYKTINQNAYLYKSLSLAFASKVDSYVYDSIQRSLYVIGDNRWALNLSELSETGRFFDKNVNDRERRIDDISEYDSIDEAIRAAIEWLSELRRFDLNATISAVGGYGDIRALIEGLYADRVSDLNTSIQIVNNIPVLYASITSYSGFKPMVGYIVGYGTSYPTLSASIEGVVYSGISANINGIV